MTNNNFSGKKVVFVTWERHRRTENLASQLKVPLVIFESAAPRWLKHPKFIWKTLALLITQRPDVLIVQNPSAFLTILAILCKPFFRYKLVVDAHNAGIYPFEKSHEKFAWIFPIFHKAADLTIVTNENLADIVRKNCGRPFILPDALPAFELSHVKHKDQDDRRQFQVTFICTYASDEPYMEVFKAARQLPTDIRINVTGNSKKLTPDELKEVGETVNLTGFLSDEAFVSMLVNSDVIMDLTTFDNCLVCGAYEAVSLGVPAILSDTPVVRNYFTQGIVYTNNYAEDIASSILEARENRDTLLADIDSLKSELDKNWQLRRNELETTVHGFFAE